MLLAGTGWRWILAAAAVGSRNSVGLDFLVGLLLVPLARLQFRGEIQRGDNRQGRRTAGKEKKLIYLFSSVADPGCLCRIPDAKFLYVIADPGSEFLYTGSQIRIF
jgi:hypothetical protein